MTELVLYIYEEGVSTVIDLAPIVVVIAFFQFGIIRQPLLHLSRILIGLVYVAIGLTLFRIGLEQSLIPIGGDMARQLVKAAYASGRASFSDWLPLFAFAGLIGFTAALIEPTVIAAADKVQDLSGGSLRAMMLRLVIACGVAAGLVLGTLRIVNGIPLAYLLAVTTLLLILLALSAPRGIVPLALDSGGIATSVVTVPLIAAYGVAAAKAMPNAATAADGFGLIALALMMPAILVLGFSWLQTLLLKKTGTGGSDAV